MKNEIVRILNDYSLPATGTSEGFLRDSDGKFNKVATAINDKVLTELVNNCCELAMKWVELKEQNSDTVKFVGINDYIKQNINGKESNNNND